MEARFKRTTDIHEKFYNMKVGDQTTFQNRTVVCVQDGHWSACMKCIFWHKGEVFEFCKWAQPPREFPIPCHPGDVPERRRFAWADELIGGD